MLELIGNRIVDIRPLQSLKQLRVLALCNNKVVDITPLADLTALTELSLHDNKVVEISAISSVPDLTRLDLGYNQIQDLAPLTKLTRLENLRLQHNPLNERAHKVHIPKILRNNSETRRVRRKFLFFSWAAGEPVKIVPAPQQPQRRLHLGLPFLLVAGVAVATLAFRRLRRKTAEVGLSAS